MVRIVGSGVNDNPMEAVGANLPHKCTSVGYIVMIALDVAGDDDDDDVAPPHRTISVLHKFILSFFFGNPNNQGRVQWST